MTVHSYLQCCLSLFPHSALPSRSTDPVLQHSCAAAYAPNRFPFILAQGGQGGREQEFQERCVRVAAVSTSNALSAS